MIEPSNSTPPDLAPANGGTGRSALDWAARSGTADAILDELRSLAQIRRRRARRRIGAACALACTFALVFVVLRFTGTRSSDAIANHAAELATLATHTKTPFEDAAVTVHPPARQTLPDGSIVELRDGAAIAEIEFSKATRRVELRVGTAHFAVANDASRPFEVVANDVTVRAVGTAFCVDLSGESVEVLVTEGHVAVSESPLDGIARQQPNETREAREALLDAGERVSVAPDVAAPLEVEQISVSDWEAKLSWRVPRLEFSRARLGELLPEINRYGTRRIVLAEPTLADLRVSGALRADKTGALLELLRTSFRLDVDDSGEGDIIVRRRR